MAATASSLANPTASSNSTIAPPTVGANVSRIVKVDSSTGCTLTNASIKGLTPAEFEALSQKEIDLARVIASSAEAKILGVQERGLTTLLNSSITNIKPLINKQSVSEQSIILPYIQRRQRSHINSNYFAIANGSGTAAYSGGNPVSNAQYDVAVTTDGGNGDDDWLVTVNVGKSDWSDLTAPSKIERYFLPGSFVVVSTWDNSAGNQTSKVAVDVQFRIMGAKAGSSDAEAYVTLRPVGPTVSNAGIITGSSANPAGTKYGVENGIMQTIGNNVSDYEEWCHNQPTDLSVKLIVNWLQTTRESRIIDEKYKEILAKIMSGGVNPFLQSMVYHPLAEQNKIAAQHSQDQWTRSTWFNQAISDKQSPETYMQLPPVADPDSSYVTASGSDGTLEYKANALGIQTLLDEAARIKDLNGAALNLDSLFRDLYYLKRNREADGDSIQVIDVMTDRVTADKIFQAMNKYYEVKYGWTTQRNAQINEKITHDGIMLFNYNLYDIPEVGIQLAVFHDPFFDDIINAAGYNNLAAGDIVDDSTTPAGGLSQSRFRTLWAIDWSDVKIGVAGTKSVTRKSPVPEVMEAYKCRMDAVIKEYNLRSTRWTTMVDRPQRHLIIRNFADVVTVTATGVNNNSGALTAGSTDTPPAAEDGS